jgi:hypothetical protein
MARSQRAKDERYGSGDRRGGPMTKAEKKTLPPEPPTGNVPVLEEGAVPPSDERQMQENKAEGRTDMEPPLVTDRIVDIDEDGDGMRDADDAPKTEKQKTDAPKKQAQGDAKK